LTVDLPWEGGYPEDLTAAADGNLYGACFLGGQFNGGIIFRLTLDGDLTVLHAFPYSGDPDGRDPVVAPIQGTDGALYGTATSGGGPGGAGVVYIGSARTRIR
jgi:uncharacterized repeat protein (TIGR03803 family)